MLQRAAIVLLVVLNLGTAAWWWLHASPPADAPAETPVGAARLHLVAETSPAAQAVAADSVAMRPAPATSAVPPAASTPAARIAATGAAPTSAPTAAQPTPANAATLCEGGTGPAAAWRVWLPRLPTAEAAQATAARIGEAGFSDYLVVRDGADANTIALGRYGSEEAAQRRTAALRASGFPARCARIPPATPA